MGGDWIRSRAAGAGALDCAGFDATGSGKERAGARSSTVTDGEGAICDGGSGGAGATTAGGEVSMRARSCRAGGSAARASTVVPPDVVPGSLVPVDPVRTAAVVGGTATAGGAVNAVLSAPGPDGSGNGRGDSIEFVSAGIAGLLVEGLPLPAFAGVAAWLGFGAGLAGRSATAVTLSAPEDGVVAEDVEASGGGVSEDGAFGFCGLGSAAAPEALAT